MPNEPNGASPPRADATDLRITWSPAYRAAWDDMPEAYLAHGEVAWGRSRRLARHPPSAHSRVGSTGGDQRLAEGLGRG